MKRARLDCVGCRNEKTIIAIIVLHLDPFHIRKASAVIHCHEREEELAYCVLIDSLSCIRRSVVECLHRSVSVPCNILETCRQRHHGSNSQECAHAALRRVYLHVHCDLTVAVDRVCHHNRSISCIRERQICCDHLLAALILCSLNALHIDRVGRCLPLRIECSPAACVVVVLDASSPEVRRRTFFYEDFTVICIVLHRSCRTVDRKAEVLSLNLISAVFFCHCHVLVTYSRSALLYRYRDSDLHVRHLGSFFCPVCHFLQRYGDVQIEFAACIDLVRHLERNLDRSCRLRSNIDIRNCAFIYHDSVLQELVADVILIQVCKVIFIINTYFSVIQLINICAEPEVLILVLDFAQLRLRCSIRADQSVLAEAVVIR